MAFAAHQPKPRSLSRRTGAPPRARRAARPLRVLQVVDSLAVGGGAERYVVDLVIELRRRGFDVEVACSVDGPLRSDLERAGVTVHELTHRLAKRRFDPRYARSLRALVGERRFDLVHAHLYASIAAAALATARRPVPLVVTEHTEAPWRGPLAQLVSRVAYRHAAHVTGVSEAIRELVVGDFGIAPDKVTFVQNAVRPHDGSPPGALPVDCRDAVLIGRVARLEPEKGMEVFIDAAARLADDWPEAQFLVIGDGPLRADLERHAAAVGVDERVHFLGFRDDARALIARLDVLAISSHNDGSPLAVLEAMMSGVPVVATECGGIPGQVRDGVDGLLVAPGDTDAFAGALERLLREPERIRSMGAAARRHAQRNFGYGRMVDRIERVYADARRVA
jgi:glycosyltransferase involved in cell wall biosynthesis